MDWWQARQDPFLRGTQGQPCMKHKQCSSSSDLRCVRQHASASGTCRCPIMSSGNGVCTQRPPGLPSWCVLQMNGALSAGTSLLNVRGCCTGYCFLPGSCCQNAHEAGRNLVCLLLAGSRFCHAAHESHDIAHSRRPWQGPVAGAT